jgi:glucans biosynthesis protein
MSLSRRHFLQSLLGAPSLVYAGGLLTRARAQSAGLSFGPKHEFSFDILKERAEKMAHEIYISPFTPMPDVVHAIDYDAHGKIRFKSDLALFADIKDAHPVTLFHIGRYFKKRVGLHIVENGKAREILYSPDYFEMPPDSPAHKLGSEAGFAGFRFQEKQSRTDWRTQDWIAFLGGSYFRAIGDLGQYGLSARGVAVNVSVPGKLEEFPDFRDFWIEAPQDPVKGDAVYALLDSPSITGAYKFILSRERGVVVEVEKHLHLRKDVEQLGIAPLTTMYWYSETLKPALQEWRPEVHDSDGLQIWNGAGEQIWRPLNNPPRIVTSSFSDGNPRGFGLMQRDRNFDHYLDGVFYDRRPSVFVQPEGNWGKGEVQLVEIPTDNETKDNVTAMWVSSEPAKRGAKFSYSYKMLWQANEPEAAGRLARVVASRVGEGGQPGKETPSSAHKFVVEFLGGGLVSLAMGVRPEVIVTASRGTIDDFKIVEPVPDDIPGHWRTQFDLTVAGAEPVELRCYLRLGNDALSETWLYQYHPKP